MIRFELGEVKLANATVTIGNEPPIPAQALRDVEGNIDVTIDVLEPAKGESVIIVLNKENDATYEGVFQKKDGDLLFKSVTGGG